MTGKNSGQAADDGKVVPVWSSAAAARLKAAIKAWGKQAIVAEKIGLSRQSLSQIVSGKARPKQRTLFAICDTIGVSPKAIIGSSEDVLADIHAKLDLGGSGVEVFRTGARGDFSQQFELVPVPMDDVFASAGPGALALEEGKTTEVIAFPKPWLSRVFGNHDQLRLIGIKGDSMEPTLSDGDLAMIDRARRDPSDGVYALVMDGMLLVKRLALAGPGIVRVISDNKLTGVQRDVDLQAEADSFRVIGRVVWAGRKL